MFVALEEAVLEMATKPEVFAVEGVPAVAIETSDGGGGGGGGSGGSGGGVEEAVDVNEE